MQDYLLVTINQVGVLIPNDMKMEFDDAKKIIQKQIKKIKKVSDEDMEDYFVFNPKTRTLKKYEHDLYIDDKGYHFENWKDTMKYVESLDV